MKIEFTFEKDSVIITFFQIYTKPHFNIDILRIEGAVYTGALFYIEKFTHVTGWDFLYLGPYINHMIESFRGLFKKCENAKTKIVKMMQR